MHHVPAPQSQGSRRKTTGARRALGALLAALFSSGAASCLGVLDLDGYASAPEAFCGLLERCYGEAGFPKCEGHVGSQLAASSQEGKERFLESLSAGCLDDCNAARRCLDVPPICRGARESCTTKEQCCGFSGGLSTCNRQSCCRLAGAPCASSIDCCNDACEGDPPTCGGEACQPAGEPCAKNSDCCTDLCIPGENVCSVDTCQPDGFECSENYQCCSGLCANGKCATPSCSPSGGPCLADRDCCDQQTGCDKTLGACGSEGCLPLGGACKVNAQCCGDLFCNPSTGLCHDSSNCDDNGESCSHNDGCCTENCINNICGCVTFGEGCYEGFQCCSGSCIDMLCAACRQGGDSCKKADDCCSSVCGLGTCAGTVGCPHGICEVGGPLTPGGCARSPLEVQCIKRICETDALCCSNGWDADCTAKVGAVCQLACPPTP